MVFLRQHVMLWSMSIVNAIQCVLEVPASLSVGAPKLV